MIGDWFEETEQEHQRDIECGWASYKPSYESEIENSRLAELEDRIVDLRKLHKKMADILRLL